MDIAVGMHQHQGGREYQQDAMSIKHFGSIGVLAILADGMGGYEGGEIASRLISENFREFAIEGDDIGGALERHLLKGNGAIDAYKKAHPEVKNMGTTAIAFFMTPQTCQWVSVGDSPLYLIRNRSTITRINQNHSIAGLLDLQVAAGEITVEEAQSSPQRHMLTSAVSGDPIPQTDVSAIWSIRSRDIFILASDGIETLSEERIRQIVLKHVPVVTQANMQQASEALVSEVIAAGKRNQDNVTVILVGKIDDREPRTASYRPSSARQSRTKHWGIGAALLAVALAGLAYLLLPGSTEDVPPPKPAVITPAPAQKPASPAPSNPPLPVKQSETLKSDTPPVSKTDNETQEKPAQEHAKDTVPSDMTSEKYGNEALIEVSEAHQAQPTDSDVRENRQETLNKSDTSIQILTQDTAAQSNEPAINSADSHKDKQPDMPPEDIGKVQRRFEEEAAILARTDSAEANQTQSIVVSPATSESTTSPRSADMKHQEEPSGAPSTDVLYSETLVNPDDIPSMAEVPSTSASDESDDEPLLQKEQIRAEPDSISKEISVPAPTHDWQGDTPPQSPIRPTTIPVEEIPSDNPTIQIWNRQATRGNRRAQYELGFSYFNGTNGLTKDTARGMEWYKRSAEQGFPKALNALGYAYQLKRQFPEAINMYRMVVQSSEANPQIKKEAQVHLDNLCKRFGDLCRE